LIRSLLCRSYTHLLKKSHEKVELQLKKERADLDRYDLELRDLEKVIKEKKQAISDADLGIKDAEHQIQTLLKDKQTADNAVANLQKAYPWILEDRR
jgi:structural maintenance of chromosome 2